MTEHSIQAAKLTDYFERPNNRSLPDVAFQSDTGLAHALPTETIDLAAGKLSKEAPSHFRAIHVAGRFARDHKKTRGIHDKGFLMS